MEPNEVLIGLVFACLAAVYFVARALNWRNSRRTAALSDNAAAREEHWHGDLYDR